MRLDRYRTPGSQRGAVAIVTGLFILFVALGCAALVIDTGRLYMEQRSLQRMADSIALDTAHESALCGAGELNEETQRQQIAAANGVNSDDELEVLLGQLENVDGHWEFIEDDDPDTAEAVHVEISRTVPASLIMGGMFGNEITLSKQATARRIPQATIRVGSSLINVDSQESAILNAVFGDLLDSEVSLSAVSYEGIADATVSLQDLVNADASAGTVDELLNSNMTVGEALELFAQAASDSGVASADLEGLLEAGAAVESIQLTLAEILSVDSPAPEAALLAEVQLLDLISAAALLANEQNALTVPLGTSLSLPGLADVDVRLELYVVQAPQVAVGPPGLNEDDEWRTMARTGQVRSSLQAEASLDLLGLVQADAILGTAIDAASSSTWFKSIQCLPYSRQEFKNARLGAQSELARLSLGRFVDPENGNEVEENSEITLSALGGLLPSVLTAEITTSEPVSIAGSPEQEREFCSDMPCHVMDLPLHDEAGAGGGLGEGLATLAGSLEVDVDVTGISLPTTQVELALLEELLRPLLSGLDAVLDPVFEALGINIGATDVTLVDANLRRVELVQ